MAQTKSAPRPRRKKRTTAPSQKKPVSAAAKGITTFAGAVRYLCDRVDVERTRVRRLDRDAFRLDRMKALLRAVENPEKSLKFVHVAGTKGKGSTCTLVSQCLQACGYTVGLYTSPHLVDVRERVQINGEMISQAAFTSLMAVCADAAAKVEARHGQPTYFELLTLLAILRFAEQAVDVAVMECGLGGRLDATNVIDPEVCAVTAISLDHTQLLGSTLPDIAAEKAGIFKSGVPALTIRQEAGVNDRMRAVAEKAGTTLEVVGEDVDFSYRFEATPKLGPHTCVCLSTKTSNFEHVLVPLPGEHQALNCGLALAILDRLRSRGFDLPESKVIEGLTKVRLPGRMEMAWRSPRILLDGAHNASSLQALIRSIGAHVPYDSMVVVFGCSEDKDVKALLQQMALGADKLIFTRSKANPRAMDPAELQSMFREISGKMTQVARSLPDALELAARAVTREDLICVTGSFHLVGEAKKHLAQMGARRDEAAALAAR